MARRAYRSLQIIAVLLAIVSVSACQSTTGSRLNVRAAPTTASRVVDNLGIAGAAIMVDCYVRGQAVYGNSTWYRITSPSTGYVTAYYVKMDADDHQTMHAC